MACGALLSSYYRDFTISYKVSSGVPLLAILCFFNLWGLSCTVLGLLVCAVCGWVMKCGRVYGGWALFRNQVSGLSSFFT